MFILKFFGHDSRMADTHQHKMSSASRAHHRKELKARLIALGCIYAGFSIWWVIMSHFTAS